MFKTLTCCSSAFDKLCFVFVAVPPQIIETIFMKCDLIHLTSK